MSSADMLGPFAAKMAVSSSFGRNSYLTSVVSVPLSEALASVPSYASALAASADSRLVAAASAPEHTIKLYVFNGSTDSLSYERELRGHRDRIHDLIWVSENVILSSSEDSTARCWDVRTGAYELSVRVSRGPIFSADLQGTALAVGGERAVNLFDTRRPNSAVASAHDMHSEEITQVRFHPQREGYLLTGSVDTNINCFDLSQLGGASELEDCIDNTLPTEQPVLKMGFFGPNNSFLYSVSPVATVTLWNIDECELVGQFNSIRDDVNAVICQAAGFDHAQFFEELADADTDAAAAAPANGTESGDAGDLEFDPVPVHASMLESGNEDDAAQLNTLLHSSPADADALTADHAAAAAAAAAGAVAVCQEHDAGVYHGHRSIVYSGAATLALPSSRSLDGAGIAAVAAASEGGAPLVTMDAASRALPPSSYRMASIVDCQYDTVSETLRVLMSSAAGALSVSNLSPAGVHPLWVVPPSTAHKAQIRAVDWRPASATTPLFCVGNDARISVSLDKARVDAADAEAQARALGSASAAAGGSATAAAGGGKATANHFRQQSSGHGGHGGGARGGRGAYGGGGHGNRGGYGGGRGGYGGGGGAGGGGYGQSAGHGGRNAPYNMHGRPDYNNGGGHGGGAHGGGGHGGGSRGGYGGGRGGYGGGGGRGGSYQGGGGNGNGAGNRHTKF